jgi:hypothetical protein
MAQAAGRPARFCSRVRINAKLQAFAMYVISHALDSFGNLPRPPRYFRRRPVSRQQSSITRIRSRLFHPFVAIASATVLINSALTLH